MVRYADDIVIGFQYKSEAERFWVELRERFHKFNLELHAEKTRLIEFGRFAAASRAERGRSKPETFNFLGFTHICGKTRKGKFIVLRKPMKKRMQAKLKEIKIELRRRMHDPVPEVGCWLQSVVNGWYRYYAVPLTYRKQVSFRRRVGWLWMRSLRRRSQKTGVSRQRLYRLLAQWLPEPQIVHPYPWDRLRVWTRGRSPVR